MPLSVAHVHQDNTKTGKTHAATPIAAAGGIANADLDVAGYDTLVLLARMTAGAAADLTLTVRAYDDAGALFDLTLPAEATVAPALAGGESRTIQRLNVRGLTRVQVRVANANAAAQTANVSYVAD